MRTFTLKPEHIKLLSRASVYFDDSAYDGAPAIDIKRPYGNSGGVEVDVAEILDRQPPRCPHCGEVLTDADAQDEEFKQLHRETADALAVILSARSFVPGVYEKHGGQWRRVGEAA
jgi:hypothetical protein